MVSLIRPTVWSDCGRILRCDVFIGWMRSHKSEKGGGNRKTSQCSSMAQLSDLTKGAPGSVPLFDQTVRRVRPAKSFAVVHGLHSKMESFSVDFSAAAIVKRFHYVIGEKKIPFRAFSSNSFF